MVLGAYANPHCNYISMSLTSSKRTCNFRLELNPWYLANSIRIPQTHRARAVVEGSGLSRKTQMLHGQVIMQPMMASRTICIAQQTQLHTHTYSSATTNLTLPDMSHFETILAKVICTTNQTPNNYNNAVIGHLQSTNVF